MKYRIVVYNVINGNERGDIHIGDVKDLKEVQPFIKYWEKTHDNENGLLRYYKVYDNTNGKRIKDDWEWLQY